MSIIQKAIEVFFRKVASQDHNSKTTLPFVGVVVGVAVAEQGCLLHLVQGKLQAELSEPADENVS